MNTNLTITEQVTIPHTAFATAAARLDHAYELALRGAEPDGLAIVGESRTGKTSVLEGFASKHTRTRRPDGLHIPVLRVVTPPTPSVKSLASTMLNSIGDPDPYRGTESQMTHKLKTQIRATGVKVLLCDEFQHFWDRGKQKVMYQAADWLKVLIEQTGTTVVVAGLTSCLAVIEQNEQLMRRFSAPLRLERFQWDVAESRSQFTGILDAYHAELSNEYELPDLSNEAVAFRFYMATGGLIGLLAKLLRRAEQEAVLSERNRITLDDFDRAHKRAIWSHDADQLRPFAAGFNAQPSIELIRRAATIGLEHSDVEPRPRKSTRSARPPSISSLLVAR